MGRFDDELQRRASESLAQHFRTDSAERDRATRIAELEKIKWAEIAELCCAGVRQLESAGIPKMEVGEDYASKTLWIVGEHQYRYRPSGSAWVINGSALFFLFGDATLTGGTTGKNRHGRTMSFVTAALDGKYLVRPLGKYSLVSPRAEYDGGEEIPLENWELGTPSGYGDIAPFLLKPTLLRGISNTMAGK